MSGGRLYAQWRLTIAGFIEAVARVAVRCEDGHLVTTVLQGDSGIDHETLGAAYAQIRVEEDGVLLLLRHRKFVCWC